MSELKQPQETPGFNARLNELELLNEEMKKTMANYSYRNEQAWLNFRKTFSRKMDELSVSLKVLADWWN